MIIDTKSHYIIAEIGHNNQGNIDKAFELIYQAIRYSVLHDQKISCETSLLKRYSFDS